MEDKLQCPICRNRTLRLDSTIPEPPGHAQIGRFDCKVCGPFFLDAEAESVVGNEPLTIDKAALVSAKIREQKEIGNTAPVLYLHDIDIILKEISMPRVPLKLHRLMKHFECLTDYPGQTVGLNPKFDYPLAWAHNEMENRYLVETLIARKLLVTSIEQVDAISVMISHDGWEYLEKYAHQPPYTDTAFVAMSFDKKMDTVWEKGIKPAIEEAGYTPVRVDKTHYIEKIDARIIRQIKESKFIIADVTQQKQGVYFEAGFAQGLDRPVIWSVREDDLGNVHFDTRQFNHIVWKSVDHLKEELYDRICAVIGKGPRVA